MHACPRGPCTHSITAALVYANSLDGEFVFDDHHSVLRNADVDASKTPLSNLFRNNMWGYHMQAENAEHQVGSDDAGRDATFTI